MLKIYRLSLGKCPLSIISEQGLMFISNKTKRPLSVRQIFNLVKRIVVIAAEKFENPLKQVKRGDYHHIGYPAATMIQKNLRHESTQTTGIYLHGEDELRHQAI